jgi:uncharacterized protein YuzE
MKFYYDSVTDILGIRFVPARKGDTRGQRQEILPGVQAEFDAKGNLVVLDILKASAHQPDLRTLVGELVQEVVRRSKEIPQEVLLAIEGTIRLNDDLPAGQTPQYTPRFSYDARADVLVTEFRTLPKGDAPLAKKEVIPGIQATFDQAGQLLSMEMHYALHNFPALQQFIQQGQELQAMQHLLRGASPKSN